MSTGETKSNVRCDHSVVVVVVCAEIWFKVFVFKLLICIARLLLWRSSSVIKLFCYSFAAIVAVPPKLPMIASSELWRDRSADQVRLVGRSVSVAAARVTGLEWWRSHGRAFDDGMGWDEKEQSRRDGLSHPRYDQIFVWLPWMVWSN